MTMDLITAIPMTAALTTIVPLMAVLTTIAPRLIAVGLLPPLAAAAFCAIAVTAVGGGAVGHGCRFAAADEVPFAAFTGRRVIIVAKQVLHRAERLKGGWYCTVAKGGHGRPNAGLATIAFSKISTSKAALPRSGGLGLITRIQLIKVGPGDY